MDAICKMSKEHTTWPCSARACPLFGDCYVEYEKAIQKPQTNADRIRAMSDEELARTFAQTGNCPPSPEYGHNCKRCSKCWLDYLRQPVKDGGGE